MKKVKLKKGQAYKNLFKYNGFEIVEFIGYERNKSVLIFKAIYSTNKGFQRNKIYPCRSEKWRTLDISPISETAKLAYML